MQQKENNTIRIFCSSHAEEMNDRYIKFPLLIRQICVDCCLETNGIHLPYNKISKLSNIKQIELNFFYLNIKENKVSSLFYRKCQEETDFRNVTTERIDRLTALRYILFSIAFQKFIILKYTINDRIVLNQQIFDYMNN